MQLSRQVVAGVLAFAVAGASIGQQTTPRLSRKAATVKRQADRLSPEAPISVVRFGAQEEFGRYKSNDESGFTFYDVDRKADVTLRYEAVKKIKDGYGGYNHAANRHVDRSKNFLIVLAVAGGLAALIAAAAAAR